MSGGAKVETALRIGLAQPDIGEEEVAAVSAVLASGVLTDGPRTAAFETAFAERHQVRHAVAFANGTTALAAIFLACGIGPGDEVIVPSMTFISSATSVLHVGSLPVFADIHPDTFNIDPGDVARRVTERTKAILAVHYGGHPADMDELRALARDAGVVLLEDAAQAHGATYHGRPAGGLGKAAMFSFTPTKNITTGEGGMVTTDDKSMADQLRRLRNHGLGPNDEHVELGYNWRITEMQAAIGVVQLAKLDSILARKWANASWLGQRLAEVPGVEAPAVRPDRTHPYMLYTVLVDPSRRDRVLEGLRAAGIEAKVYFPPAHRQVVLALTTGRPDLPVTEDVAARMLSLPFHSRLCQSELVEIADTVQRLTAA
jgi:perosamine synthetase